MSVFLMVRKTSIFFITYCIWRLVLYAISYNTFQIKKKKPFEYAKAGLEFKALSYEWGNESEMIQILLKQE